MKKKIKKIKIETVESFLGIKLTRNKICIGFDVCMHATGIAIIRTTTNYLVLENTDKIIVPKNIDLLKGIDSFLSQLDDIKRMVSQKYNLNISIIEDCFFGQNVKTLKALARFGILIYDRFRGISTEVQLMLPTSARSKIKFKKSNKKIKGNQLKKEIIDYINNALDIKNKDTDIADAIVLSLAGLVEV